MVKINIVSLTCCAGCVSSIINAGERLYDLLQRGVEVVYSPTFVDTKEIQRVGIAIVEGGVKTDEDEDITGKDIRVKVTRKEGRGVGIVEVPRGTLIHDYQFDGEGKCKELHLIIPTQINNAAINISMKNEAFELIRSNTIKPGLFNRVEMVIRVYDPCIKCATRNQNGGVKVEIRDFEGNLVREL